MRVKNKNAVSNSFILEPKTLKLGASLGFTSVAVIILAVLVLGGLFVAYRVTKNETPKAQNQTGELKDWKTYRNDKYGFEFRYYKNWVVDESGNDGSIVSFGPKPDSTPALEGLGVKIYYRQNFPNAGKISSVEELKEAVKQRYAEYDPEVTVVHVNGFDAVLADGLPGIADTSSDAWLFLGKGFISIYPGYFIDSFFKLDGGQESDTTENGESHIESVIPSSAKIGTVIEVRGENLAGFEGDKNLWIVGGSGEKGIIYGLQPDSTDTLIRFKLADRYCSTDTSYSSLVCPSYITVLPGEYQIFANPWGKMSNKIEFVVKE